MRVFDAETAKSLIDEKGFRRPWVAEKVEVTPGTFTQYLSGNGRPSHEFVRRLAAFLNVETERLYVEMRRAKPA